ncbi:hypothetical protein T265_03284 [Opisthorchis viverrini]|uniref:Uncharacterized protein n=1 Tax=Opisthorchis viverrini TaxID=6198 RepID=A0A075AHP1_OPIVI|nr:hypothetical protein T265_03284 [Opisthorchis viverrini]KER30224.1 hypothetical protein T265_03284 [Opisthorchis viverrini]
MAMERVKRTLEVGGVICPAYAHAITNDKSAQMSQPYSPKVTPFDGASVKECSCICCLKTSSNAGPSKYRTLNCEDTTDPILLLRGPDVWKS